MPLPSVIDVETACLLAWPAIEEERHGAWVLRFSRGYTNRANSMQSLDPTDDADAAERLTQYAVQYRDRALTPVFRSTPLAGPAISAALDEMGWEAFGESLVLGLALQRRLRPVSAHTLYLDPADPQWWHAQRDMSERDGKDALGDIVSRITAPARGVLLFDDDHHPVAASLVVNVDGLAIFLNVVVAAHARGQGLGRAVMHAGLNWAVQSGADRAALQVAADNEQAVPLYRSLGFEQLFSYNYRRPRS